MAEDRGAGLLGPRPDPAGRGRVGEDAAVEWLLGQGFQVVQRNARTRAGEIDVVARDGDTLCFVEIKARLSDRHGGAIAAVGPTKQRRLVRAARLWLAMNPWKGPCRFDVLALDADGGKWRYTLVKGAFTA